MAGFKCINWGWGAGAHFLKGPHIISSVTMTRVKVMIRVAVILTAATKMWVAGSSNDPSASDATVREWTSAA